MAMFAAGGLHCIPGLSAHAQMLRFRRKSMLSGGLLCGMTAPLPAAAEAAITKASGYPSAAMPVQIMTETSRSSPAQPGPLQAVQH